MNKKIFEILFLMGIVLMVILISCKKDKNDIRKPPEKWHFQTEKKVFDIDIFNNKLVAAVENGIEVYDLSNPAQPQKIADTSLSATPTIVKFANDTIIYLANSQRVFAYKFKNNKFSNEYVMLTAGYYEPYVAILTNYFNGNYTKLFIISRKKAYIMNISDKLKPVVEDYVIFSDFEAIDAFAWGGSAKILCKDGGIRVLGYSSYYPVGWSVSTSCTEYCYSGNVVSGWFRFDPGSSNLLDEPFVYALGSNGIHYFNNRTRINMKVKTKNKALGGYTNYDHVYVADSLGIHIFRISTYDCSIFEWCYVELEGVTKKIVPLDKNPTINNYLYTVSGNAGFYILKRL